MLRRLLSYLRIPSAHKYLVNLGLWTATVFFGLLYKEDPESIQVFIGVLVVGVVIARIAHKLTD